jgi:hypothetical protein
MPVKVGCEGCTIRGNKDTCSVVCYKVNPNTIITKTSLMGEPLEVMEKVRTCVYKVVPSSWGKEYPPSFDVRGCQTKTDMLAIIETLRQAITQTPDTSLFGFDMKLGEITKDGWDKEHE